MITEPTLYDLYSIGLTILVIVVLGVLIGQKR